MNTMIKKTAFIMATSCALISFTHAGENEKLAGFYIGGQVGESKTDLSSSEIVTVIEGADSTVNNLSLDKEATLLSIFAGYHINEQFSFELGYLDLGNRDMFLSVDTLDKNALLNRAEEIYPETGEGIMASVAYHYSITDKWNASAKVGLFSWEQKFNLNNTAVNTGNALGSDKRDGNSITFAGEIGYQWQEDVELFTEFMVVELDKQDVQNISVGIRFSL